MYGTGCITNLILISFSVAEIIYIDDSKSSKDKTQHEFTLGASYAATGSIATTVSSLEESSQKNKNLEFDANQYTCPVDSPTDTWISKLYEDAIQKIIAKDWKNVKDPIVNPIKPDFPDYPVVPPKESEKDTFDTLSKEFDKLHAENKPYSGLKLYNMAQKELVYAALSKDEKSEAKANSDINKARTKLTLTDFQAIEDLITALTNATVVEKRNYIKDHDLSVPYLFAKDVKFQNVDPTQYTQDLLNDFVANYKQVLDAFTLNTIAAYVNGLSKPEKIKVNTYANLMQSYPSEFNLSSVQNTKVKKIFETSKSMLTLLLGNAYNEVPVTEEQFNDAILLVQMQNDCFDCKNVEEYKVKLLETEANFYTEKIIDEILKIEIR